MQCAIYLWIWCLCWIDQEVSEEKILTLPSRFFRMLSASSPSLAMKHRLTKHLLHRNAKRVFRLYVWQTAIFLQVGLVAYSTEASIEFDLDDFQSEEGVIAALRDVQYTKGWTATALALLLTRHMLDPNRGYGARPFSDGIPKVAVLLTDGRSNQLPITERANALRDFGVQVSI